MPTTKDAQRPKLVIEVDKKDKDGMGVSVEPWGEYYDLQAGDVMEVFPSGRDGYFHQVKEGREFSLYFEGGYEYPSIFLNGKDVTGMDF